MMWSVGLKGHTYLHGVYISGLHRNCYPTENMSPQPCAELHVTKGVAHYSAQSIFMSKYLPFLKKKKKLLQGKWYFHGISKHLFQLNVLLCILSLG